MWAGWAAGPAWARGAAGRRAPLPSPALLHTVHTHGGHGCGLRKSCFVGVRALAHWFLQHRPNPQASLRGGTAPSCTFAAASRRRLPEKLHGVLLRRSHLSVVHHCERARESCSQPPSVVDMLRATCSSAACRCTGSKGRARPAPAGLPVSAQNPRCAKRNLLTMEGLTESIVGCPASAASQASTI